MYKTYVWKPGYPGRMSQKEDLIRGAKQCIAEKGYGHTTARDIAAASGANLASIGYHFGSKEALLNAAVLEVQDEWGDAIESAVGQIEAASPTDRLEQVLERYSAGISDVRGTLASSMQALAQAEFTPVIREQVRASFDDGRRSLAALVSGTEQGEAGEEDPAVGALVLALIQGLGLQWFIDEGSVPSPEELMSALRRLGDT